MKYYICILQMSIEKEGARNMKGIWKKGIAIGLAIGCLLMAGCGHKSDVQNALPDKIIIGLDDNFPPMGFRDNNGDLVGFDIDLAREVEKRIGIPVSFQTIDWDSKEAALKSGQVDMLWNGLTITPEREKVIAFSKPYMKNDQLLIVRASSNIQNKDGFKGKVIGTQEGSSSIDALNRHIAFQQSLGEVKKYGDFVNAFMDLQLGRIDGVLVDSVVGRYYMEKKAGQFRVVDTSLGEETFGIGMRKEDTALCNKINQVLKELSDDGTMAALSQKWLGEDITLKVK